MNIEREEMPYTSLRDKLLAAQAERARQTAVGRNKNKTVRPDSIKRKKTNSSPRPPQRQNPNPQEYSKKDKPDLNGSPEEQRS